MFSDTLLCIKEKDDIYSSPNAKSKTHRKKKFVYKQRLISWVVTQSWHWTW
jgi:hypothetical protein